MLVSNFWIKPRHYIAHYSSVLSQSSGYICLSILDEDDGWRPAITIKQVLIGIQELLDDPNVKSPAQRDAYELFVKDKPAYRKKIKEQAVKNPQVIEDENNQHIGMSSTAIFWIRFVLLSYQKPELCMQFLNNQHYFVSYS